MPTKTDTHICITMDTEPDIDTFGRSSLGNRKSKSGFFGITEGIPRLLEVFERVEGKTGKAVNVTWFTCHDEWAKIDAKFSALLDKVKGRGDEIGLHTHFVKNGRYAFDLKFQKTLISEGTDSLRDKGFDVTSFRGGAYHFDITTLRIIEELGYTADSSIVPGMRRSRPDGFWIDFHDCIITEPYHLNCRNQNLPGFSNVVECPIATVWKLKFVIPSYKKTRSFMRIGVFMGRRYLGLGLIQKDYRIGLKMLNNIINHIESQPKVIVLPFHPWELIEDFSSKRITPRYLENIERFLVMCAASSEFSGRVEFSTVAKAVSNWRDRNPFKYRVESKTKLYITSYLEFLESIRSKYKCSTETDQYRFEA